MREVNLLLGRFQPFTAGHFKCAETAHRIMGIPTVIAMINTPDTKLDKSHPFPTSILLPVYKKMVEKNGVFADIVIVKNANIVDIGKELAKRGYIIKSWTCGTDRLADYTRISRNYKKDAGLHKDFRMIEIKRTDKDISATAARAAMDSNDIVTFRRLTDVVGLSYDPIYDTMKGELAAVNEGLYDIYDLIDGDVNESLIGLTLLGSVAGAVSAVFLLSSLAPVLDSPAADFAKKMAGIVKDKVDKFRQKQEEKKQKDKEQKDADMADMLAIASKLHEDYDGKDKDKIGIMIATAAKCMFDSNGNPRSDEERYKYIRENVPDYKELSKGISSFVKKADKDKFKNAVNQLGTREISSVRDYNIKKLMNQAAKNAEKAFEKSGQVYKSDKVAAAIGSLVSKAGSFSQSGNRKDKNTDVKKSDSEDEGKTNSKGETVKDEMVTDPETGKKIKAAVHTGPRGGRYYWPKGKPKTPEHKVYVQESLKDFITNQIR